MSFFSESSLMGRFVQAVSGKKAKKSPKLKQRSLRVENLENREMLNVAPIANDDMILTTQNNAVVIDYALDNDTDADGDNLVIQSKTNPSHGTLVKNNNTKYTYTPNNGYTGPDQFTFTITYGNGGTDTSTVKVGVNKPIDVDAARDQIMNGLNRKKFSTYTGNATDGFIPVKQVWKQTIAYGPTAFQLFYVAGKLGPVVVGSTWDDGRILLGGGASWSDLPVLGNNTTIANDGTKTMALRSIVWAAGTSNKGINIVTQRQSNVAWLQAEGYTNVSYHADWENYGNTADLIIGNINDRDNGGSGKFKDDVTPARQAAIKQMMARGKGFYGAVNYAGGSSFTLPIDAPINTFLADAGIAVSPVGSWVPGNSLMGTMPPTADNFRNIGTVLSNRSAYNGYSQGVMGVQAELVAKTFSVSSPLLGEYYDSDLKPHLAVLPIPTVENPITNTLDKSLLRFESAQLQGIPQSEVVAHHSALPISASEPRVSNQSVTVNDGIYLPYYLAPGEELTLQVPQSWLNAGVTLTVSHLGESNATPSSYNSYPGQVRSLNLESGMGTTIKFKTPFGGLVRLTVPSSQAASIAGTTATLSNVLQTPYFKLGETTDAQWNNGIRQRKTPFMVLEGDHVWMVLQTEVHKNNTKPKRSLEIYDNATNFQKDYYGYTNTTQEPRLPLVQRFNAKRGVSGRPQFLLLGVDALNYRKLKTAYDGLLIHENGHNLELNQVNVDNSNEALANIAGDGMGEEFGFRTNKGWAAGYQREGYINWVLVPGKNPFEGGDHGATMQRMTLWQSLNNEFGAQTVRDLNHTMRQLYESNSSLFNSSQKRVNQWALRIADQINADPTEMMGKFYLNADSATKATIAAAHPQKWSAVEVIPQAIITEKNKSITFQAPDRNYEYVGNAFLSSTNFVQPSHGTVSQNSNGTYNYTPNNNYTGKGVIKYKQTDSLGYVHTFEMTASVLASSNAPKLSAGLVNASTSWKTVTLNKDFGSGMVVIAVPVWKDGDARVVTRIRNATGNSFQVKVQRIDGQSGSLSNIKVHYVVSKVGVWNVAQHGFAMEVSKVNSTVTDRKDNFVGQTYNLKNHTDNHYMWNEVLGQVQTANDADWSAFYATKKGELGERFGAYDDMQIGKHVGEDPDTTRANETIGLLMYDQVWGNLQVGDTIFSPTGFIPTTDGSAGSNKGYHDTQNLSGFDGAVAQIHGVLNSEGDYDVIHDVDGDGNPFEENRLIVKRYEDGLADAEYDITLKTIPSAILYKAIAQIGTSSNTVPNAVNDSITTAQNVAHTFNPRSNDTDADGDSLTITGKTNGSNGSVSFTSSNVTYTPNNNYTGSDSFTYTISDGNGGADTATVNVTVTGSGNTVPNAVNDSITTSQNVAHTFNPRSNDTDADGDSLTITGKTNGSNGSVSFTSSNVTYTPNNNYTGSDSFTYTISDGNGGADTATVNVTVNATSTSPKLFQKIETNVTGNWKTINLGQNYNSAVIVATPMIANNSIPVVTRIRNVSGSTFQLKLQHVDSPAGAIPSMSVSIIVVEEGVYTQGANGVKMEAVKYNSTVTDRSGAWNAQSRSYQNSYSTPVVVGQVMTENDSQWSAFWSKGSSVGAPPSSNALNVGKHVGGDTNATRIDETVGYIVIEAGNGTLDGTKFTAGVGADIVKGTDDTTTGYNYSLTGLSSAGAAAVSQMGMDGTDGGWATLFGTNSIQSNSLTLAIDEDAIGDDERNHTTEQVGYLVLEGTGSSNTVPNAVNDSITTAQNVAHTFNPRSNDTDADGDSLTITGKTNGSNGSVSFTSSNVTYTPNNNYTGSDSFTYTISDGNGGADTATVNVTVTGSGNTVPNAVNDSITTSQNVAHTFNPRSNDTDADGDSLTITGKTNGSNGSVSFTSSNVTYTPNNNYTGSDSFTYTISDGNGGADTATVNVTVNATSTSPKLFQKIETNVTGNWKTINLGQNYNSAVIVATPMIANNSIPVVTRIRNVSGSTFQLKLQHVDSPAGAIPSMSVSIIVVEEGVYTQGANGVKMEAVKYNSTVTDRSGAWNAQSRSYQNSYSTPVVVGQVMTENDSQWSAFWSKGSSVGAPPSSNALNVGKHVGGDTNATRIDETVGYIVIEAGNGTLDGTKFTAGVGADIVKGTDDTTTGYNYSLTGLSSAGAAAVSQMGMDGTDGGWATLFGTNSIQSNSLTLAIDEDAIGDDERNHTTEQVGYLVLEGTGSSNTVPNAVNDSITTAQNVAHTFNPRSNDTDADGDSLTITGKTNGSNGTVSFTSSNVTYTPNNNYTGSDSFTYTISDGNGGADTATVNVTVTGSGNTVPNAVNDSITTSQNVAHTFNPRSNDTDADGDSLTITGKTNGSNGTVSFTSSNVTYTPNNNYTGSDSFTYTISDGNGGADTATVNVTVNATGGPQPVGLWNFENSGNLTAATTGSALASTGSDTAVTGSGGSDTGAASLDNGDHYTVTNSIGGNGGGSKTNKYTLLMDVKAAAGGYNSLLELNGSGDADFFINSAGKVGISGDYFGTLADGTFHRLLVVVDLGSATPITTYIDGALAHAYTGAELAGDNGAVDGRWSLGSTFEVFNDGSNGGEEKTTAVSNLAIFDQALTLSQASALGNSQNSI